MCNEYPYETVNIIQIGVLGHGKCFCSSVDVLIEFHANNITGSGPVLSMLIYQQECGEYVFFSAITDVNNKNMKYKMIYYAYEILKVAYPCLLIIFRNTPCFYTPVWKTGRIMPWQCPSVRPSVCPSAFSGLFFNMLWDINLKLGIHIQ